MNIRLIIPALLLSLPAAAQSFPAGYNNVESAVKPYTELDPLTFANGKPVTRKMWPARRAEILHLFEQSVFGRTPASAQHLPVRERDRCAPRHNSGEG